jgi:hypothetical protein
MKNTDNPELFGEAITDLRQYAQALKITSAGKLVPTIIATRAPQMSSRIAEGFFQCADLFSKPGDAMRILMVKQQLADNLTSQRDLNTVLSWLAYDPTIFRDKAVWLFFQALLQMQTEFATKWCPAPSKEETLTGKLVSALGGACSDWQKIGADVLAGTGETLELKEVDLQVLGGEPRTGGDFALVLEFGNSLARTLVPVIFQAKRFTGKTVDVSREHEIRGYQFDILVQQKCSVAYVFYENGTTNINPCMPPIVKSASKIVHPSVRSSTNPFADSVDFATFAMSLINGGRDIPVAKNENEALAMILADADPARLHSIAVVSNSAGVELRYQLALQQVLNAAASHRNEKPKQENGGPKPSI